MSALTLTLALQVRNMDAGETASIILDQKNRLRIDLKNRGTAPMVLHPDSALVLGFGRDMAPDRVAAARVAIVSAGSSPQVPQMSRVAWKEGAWSLSPLLKVAIAPGETISIEVSELAIPSAFDQSVTVLTCSWSNARTITDGREEVAGDDGRAIPLSVRPGVGKPESSAPPPPLKVGWLAEAGGPSAVFSASGIIAITPGGHRLPDGNVEKAREIRNRFAFRLQNTSFAPLVRFPAPGPAPEFFISWFDAEESDPRRYNALCTPEQSTKIRCSLLGDDQADWAIDFDQSNRQWRLTPKSPQVLFARESIVVVVEDLASTLPPYPTALYITYRNLPGYPDGVLQLDMEKVTAWPTIARFEQVGGNDAIYPGEEIALSWDCWGEPQGYEDSVSLFEEAAGVTPRLLAGPVAAADGLYRLKPAQATTYYRLSMAVPKAPADAHLRVRIGAASVSLEVHPPKVRPGGSATLRYVYRYAGSATLSPLSIDLPPAREGRGEISVTPSSATEYSLTVEGMDGPLTATARVAMDYYGSKIFLIIGNLVHCADENGSVGKHGPLPSGTAEGLRDFAIAADPYVVRGEDLLACRRNPDPNQASNGDEALIPWGETVYRVTVYAAPLRGVVDQWAAVPVFEDKVPHFGYYITCVEGARDSFPAAIMDTPEGAQSHRDIVQARYGGRPDLLLGLDGIGALRALQGMEVLRYDVESFDITEDGSLFIVDRRTHGLSEGIAGPGGWEWRELLTLPDNSTRIAVTKNKVVYWVENRESGSKLCRYVEGLGREEVAQLPGLVPFFGIALRPDARMIWAQV